METSSFEAELDFCPECGAILKLNHLTINAVCAVCSYETSVKGLVGVKTSYEIGFTPLGHYSHLKKQKKREKNSAQDVIGQMDNERYCSKCGHKGMAYTTMQLRSADEGQTVFYLCPQCKNREVENS